MKSLPIIAVLGMAAWWTARADAQELRYSENDTRRLSFLGDPDRLYFRPGNDGSFLFTDPRTSHPSNLQPWQDEYCDARQLVLESERYTVRASSSDTSETQAYWNRMHDYMRGMSMEGTLSTWIITDEFVQAWQKDRALARDVASHALEFRIHGYSVPMLLIDVAKWDDSAERVHQQLAAELPGWPIAVYSRQSNVAQTRNRRWGCVVVDEELVPPTYRGQAIASWLHARYGQVPVIVSPKLPNFYRDTIWSAAGVAGILYRPLPPDTPANEHTAIHLRASSTYMSRFGNQAVRLAWQPATPEFQFNLEVENHTWSGVLRAGGDAVRVQMPDWMIGKAVGGAWFNPATDENIVEPLTTATAQAEIRAPSAAVWAYSRSVTTAVPDTATTVSVIRPWE